MSRVIVGEAYDHFRDTGELPEDQRLAEAVVRRVWRGPEMVAIDEAENPWQEFGRRGFRVRDRPEDPFLDELLSEALWEEEPLRTVARLALQQMVALGLDVTRPLFAESGIAMELPARGTVGMALLGIPEIFLRAPYRAQAKRLFARCEALGLAIQCEDSTWASRFDAAVEGFCERGEVPEDDLVFRCVLALGEFHGLVENSLGHGDAEAMAAFDAAGRGRGKRRAEAVERLCRMARSGRFAQGDS
ncbi:MAG: hypothetical protein U1E73_09485 [Planctomycetota bacterium]